MFRNIMTQICVICYHNTGDAMETHEILKGLREDRDLTQQDIADLLKIGRTMYRRYETGETELPIRHLKTLCVFYGVSSDYVIGLSPRLRQKTRK